MKAKVGNKCKTEANGCNWAVVASLFADDTVLLGDSERERQGVVHELHMVCMCVRRKLRVNAWKSS